MPAELVEANQKTKERPHELTKQDFLNRVSKCHNVIEFVIDNTPKEWGIPNNVISNKLSQLFESKWLDEVWRNYQDCINENILS